MKNAAFAVACALAGTSLVGCGGENPNEKLADRVTTAIVANDMRPVEKEFNAIVRPKLSRRQTVGRLSDDLAPLGKFKRTKENTPAGSEKGRHTFVAQFEKGTYAEDMTIDDDGKIAAFHLHPSEPSATK